ncbi:dimethylsulfonioproprionate lyase family protein [Roseobacter weihaiensis]|uniref:dimethylsulfonioproprionate lyase family protein n=1 Tax=Roseobacter weihaiensis TaxID=2763262 RepID=UPI001D0A0E8B|nr:dimethylsulfonioproprionate lyase family protein [Roseobacter sp. H9]
MTHRLALRTLLDAAAEKLQSSGNDMAEAVADALVQTTLPADGPPPATVRPCEALTAAVAHSNDPLFGRAVEALLSLPWRAPGFGRLPARLADRMAVVELLGPTGYIRHKAVRVGFLFQDAQLGYPPHSHAAEEIYLLLQGQADWQIDGRPIGLCRAGKLVHHLPWQPHAMQTAKEPLLALWAWRGEIGADHYRLEAPASCGAGGPPGSAEP